jgi:DNA (cytosine-5)-methyltransferase 1
MIDYELKTGPWNLSDLKSISKNGLKVFSCFHCGGGSTMGYKLAGFDVLGGVEIDPVMSKIYVKNHNPKHEFLMGVQEFKNIPDNDLPPELFDLDILDGSPPCSSFSRAGSREEGWGKKKKFREGQANQVLDDLFFDFIDIAKKLKPKVVVAENVKGLIHGNARGYVKKIFQGFRDAGYQCQLFLLNAAAMGVPQKRERVFFIARRNDLGYLNIKLQFKERSVSVSESCRDLQNQNSKGLTDRERRIWKWCNDNNETCGGKYFLATIGRRTGFNSQKLRSNDPSLTVTASSSLFHWSEKRKVSDSEYIRIQSFPEDYKFLNQKVKYICGMSVPPFMTQRVANQIYKQWLGE